MCLSKQSPACQLCFCEASFSSALLPHSTVIFFSHQPIMILDRALESFKKFDTHLSYTIYSRVPKTKRIRSILKGLEWSCNGFIWLAATFIFSYCDPKAPWYQDLFVGLIADIIYVAMIKAYFRRRRPTYAQQTDQITISVDKHSFPSGHATRAIYVALFAGHLGSITGFIIWFWSISVALSRILLGRHHVFDVLVGCLIGCLEYILQFYIGFPLYPLLRLIFPNPSSGEQFAEGFNLNGDD